MTRCLSKEADTKNVNFADKYFNIPFYFCPWTKLFLNGCKKLKKKTAGQNVFFQRHLRSFRCGSRGPSRFLPPPFFFKLAPLSPLFGPNALFAFNHFSLLAHAFFPLPYSLRSFFTHLDLNFFPNPYLIFCLLTLSILHSFECRASQFIQFLFDGCGGECCSRERRKRATFWLRRVKKWQNSTQASAAKAQKKMSQTFGRRGERRTRGDDDDVFAFVNLDFASLSIFLLHSNWLCFQIFLSILYFSTFIMSASTSDIKPPTLPRVEFAPSQKRGADGKNVVAVFRGFTYHHDRRRISGCGITTIYWRCCRRGKCPARIRTDASGYVTDSKLDHHNHSAEETLVSLCFNASVHICNISSNFGASFNLW